MSSLPSVPADSILPDALVSSDWLAAHLGDPRLRIVDIRGYVHTVDLGDGLQEATYTGARDEYDAGHLPDAVYVDWTSDITDPDHPIKAQLAPPERFAAAMSERGIGDETDVVAVDHSGGHFATRLWWALRAYGHDRVAVLDGGFAKWTAEGRPLSTDVPSPENAVFTPRRRPEMIAAAEDVLGMISDPTRLTVDARDPAQYRGEIARGSRGGHIPGAVSIPSKTLVNSDGTWKPIQEQRQILESRGVRPHLPVVAYCNGGVTATAILFALHRIGHHAHANYDGSWNEWGERPDLPIES